MFTCWPSLLPELRDCLRLACDPLARAHIAMTCRDEAAWRKAWYKTHRGRRLGNSTTYLVAALTWGTEEMLENRMTDPTIRLQLGVLRALYIFRALLAAGKDVLVLRILARAPLDTLWLGLSYPLHFANSRGTSRVLWEYQGLAIDDDWNVYWDVREGVHVSLDCMPIDAIATWAAGEEKMELLSQLYDRASGKLLICKHPSLVFLEALFRAGWHVLFEGYPQQLALSVVEIVVKYQPETWCHYPQHLLWGSVELTAWAAAKYGLNLYEDWLTAGPPIPDELSSAFIEAFNLPVRSWDLQCAFYNGDYATIVWMLSRPPGPIPADVKRSRIFVEQELANDLASAGYLVLRGVDDLYLCSKIYDSEWPVTLCVHR